MPTLLLWHRGRLIAVSHLRGVWVVGRGRVGVVAGGSLVAGAGKEASAEGPTDMLELARRSVSAEPSFVPRALPAVPYH